MIATACLPAPTPLRHPVPFIRGFTFEPVCEACGEPWCDGCGADAWAER